MQNDTWKLRTGLALPLMLALAVGCGDDEAEQDPVSDAGMPGDNNGNANGDDNGDTNGETDAGNDPLAVTEVFSGVVSGVSDLRGLTYAADGKIYASGYATVEMDQQIAVARFNADGSLDTGFDADGIATFNLIAIADDTVADGKGNEDSAGIVELTNGDLIVQANVNDGLGGRNVALIKLNSAGVRDTAFGTVKIDFGWSDADMADWPEALPPSDQSWGIELDSSDAAAPKVVVFGDGPAPRGALDVANAQRIDRDRYIVRVLASDGSRDAGFATAGVYTTDVDGAALSDAGRRGIVEPNGAIVSAGYTNFGEGFNNHVVVIRLLPDGTPDPKFGFGTATPGTTKFNPFLSSGGMSEAYAVGLQSSGRWVTTGYGVSNFEVETQENDLVSFGISAGKLDDTYGADGSYAVQSEGDPMAGVGTRPYRENGRDIAILDDDSALHVGCYDDKAALFLMSPDGGLTESFGEGGKLVFDHGLPFHKVAKSKDGSRLAAVTQGGAPGVLLAIVEASGG